jgi:hypothetical protein
MGFPFTELFSSWIDHPERLSNPSIFSLHRSFSEKKDQLKKTKES